jgi:hypothetical protein
MLVLRSVEIDARAGGLYGREFATPKMDTACAGADDASTCYAEYDNTWRTYLGIDEFAPLARPVHVNA